MASMQTVPAFDLRISIEDTEPEIWRRLIVPESLTVPQFHEAIQRARGRHRRGAGVRRRTG